MVVVLYVNIFDDNILIDAICRYHCLLLLFVAPIVEFREIYMDSLKLALDTHKFVQ